MQVEIGNYDSFYEMGMTFSPEQVYYWILNWFCIVGEHKSARQSAGPKELLKELYASA